MKRRILYTAISLLAGTAFQAQSATVTPVEIDGNPTCAELGYDFEAKSDQGSSNTIDLIIAGVDIGDATVSTSDGVTFSWSSTVPVDMVISKGGDGANLYTYEGESSADGGLLSPNNASGNAAAISHVTFCFDLELEVTKTADTSYTRKHVWNIEKTGSASSLTLRPGTTGSIDYTVTPSSTAKDSDFLVSGDVIVSNPWPLDASVDGVTDQMLGMDVAVDCSVAFPAALPAGESFTCTYTQPLVGHAVSSVTNLLPG